MTTATIKNGQVVVNDPIDLPDNTLVAIVPEHPEFQCPPETPEEIAEWARELAELPPLFDSDEEIDAFEARLADAKAEQINLLSVSI